MNNKSMQNNSKTILPNPKRKPTNKDKLAHRYLPQKLWDSANKQKKLWLDAVSETFELKKNEYAVLEALTYLTDENGMGTPAIGTIAERVKGFCSYASAQSILKKLAEKKIIRITRRGRKVTNVYDLIGFNFELSSCFRDNSNYKTPSLFSKKKKRERDVNNNICDEKPSLRSKAATVFREEKKDKDYVRPIPAQMPWIPPKEMSDQEGIWGDAAKSHVNAARAALNKSVEDLHKQKEEPLTDDYTQSERDEAIEEFVRIGITDFSEPMLKSRMNSNRKKRAN